MKYLSVLSLIFLYSCASTSPQNKSIGDIEEADFKAPRAVRYSKKKDYIAQKSGPEHVAFSSESLVFKTEDLPELENVNSVLTLCHEGDVKDGLALARRGHGKFRKDPSYWNAIGSCYLKSNNYFKAILYYNKALDVAPGYAPALNNLGVIYIRRGDEQKAMVAFKKSLSNLRGASSASYNLALLYLKYGLANKALKLGKKVLRKHPQDKLFASLYIAALRATNSSSLLKSTCAKYSSYISDDDAMEENCK